MNQDEKEQEGLEFRDHKKDTPVMEKPVKKEPDSIDAEANEDAELEAGETENASRQKLNGKSEAKSKAEDQHERDGKPETSTDEIKREVKRELNEAPHAKENGNPKKNGTDYPDRVNGKPNTDPKINPERIADPQTEIEDLVDHIKDYLDTRRELFVLKMFNKIFTIVSNTVIGSVLGFLGIVVFLFLSVGAAMWVGSLMENAYTGFFIVAGFYAVLGLFIYLLREKLIKKPIMDKLVNQMLND